MKRTPLCALLLSATTALSVNAQGNHIGVGDSYETFSFRSPDGVGVRSVSLVSLPLAARFRLNESLVLELESGWASGRLVRADNSESTISGPTDTEMRVLLGLGGNVVITGIAQLPTGSQSLTYDEADVAGVVAADVLPFRISNWGTGGGVGMRAAVTRTLGEFGAGIAVGWEVGREFEPLENEFAYRPGNQFSVRAAIDRTFGNSGKASLVVTLRRINADKIDGSNLFQAGNRYEAVGSYAFAVGGTGAGILYAGYLRRDEGEFLGTSEIWPLENLLFTGAGIELPLRAGVLRPRADLRMLRRDNGVGQGYTASLGADFILQRGRAMIMPTLLGRFGNIILRDSAESQFTGFDLGVTVRFGG